MRIWFPTIRAGSGVDTYVNRLAEGLEKFGVNAKITWFDSKFEFAPFLLSGVKPPEKTDIIHANSWNAFAFSKKNIPLVVTEHHCVLDPGFSRYKGYLQIVYHQALIRRFECASFRRASRVVAVSQYTAGSLRKVFNINSRVIYNWVDTDVFKPGLGGHDHGERFNLLFVGNRSPRKGWGVAKEIIDKLGDNFLLSATSGLGVYDDQADSGKIHSLGRLDMGGLVDAYQRCDALLFPSRYEGFGYVALEALACGKPVIAASNSALPEVVVNGECGFLCEPDNVDCFVSACNRLANNPSFRNQMGKNGRQRALDRFSSSDLVNAYIALYKELV